MTMWMFGVVSLRAWTMKSSQGIVKSVIGCWSPPGTTSVYTKEEKCQSDHGVWDLQKTYFKAHIIQWHGLMGCAVGEAKEVHS